ncbi:hypothetical protein AAFF_G00100850 [Aldrovandia affinis]|uniref:Uncharacterized protein n=1 Tax=Aldrovandia affinis TaxID=143900 RepID=A0AAD7WBP6_9TELE|nr:hypothetical protein AAFF_G00100850 [Aldrovandia affinis]
MPQPQDRQVNQLTDSCCTELAQQGNTRGSDSINGLWKTGSNHSHDPRSSSSSRRDHKNCQTLAKPLELCDNHGVKDLCSHREQLPIQPYAACPSKTDRWSNRLWADCILYSTSTNPCSS